ncbi:MAG: alpha/beta hydrolase [Rhizomicrobium sp.]
MPASIAAVAAVTIVLVHGAFADGSGWRGVTKRLETDGYSVVAPANTLRSVGSDADVVAGLLKTIKGPVVLVGHSYGGMVITNAARGIANVKALVYVDAFAPDKGESAAALGAKFPGGIGADSLAPAPLTSGVDLYIRADRFHAVFAADVDPAEAKFMAETQRAITQAAFIEPSGEPAWKTIPSWFVYGSGDLCIAPALHAFFAERAHAREVKVITGASHVAMISHPDEVAEVIERAAAAQ